MACMTHECLNSKCNWMKFDNHSGPSYCPKCGGEVTSQYDEQDAIESDCDDEETENEGNDESE